VREPVGPAINCSGDGGLIYPLLWIDVHVMGEHVGQLIVFLADGLLVVGVRSKARWDVERGTRSSSVGYTGHGGRANATGAKAREEGSAMTGSWGGGHGLLRRAEGSSGRRVDEMGGAEY